MAVTSSRAAADRLQLVCRRSLAEQHAARDVTDAMTRSGAEADRPEEVWTAASEHAVLRQLLQSGTGGTFEPEAAAAVREMQQMNAALMLQNATMRERLAKLNTKGSAIRNSQATVLERIRQCGLHVAEIIGSRLEAPDRPQATGAVQGLVSGLIGWLGADRPVVAPSPVPEDVAGGAREFRESDSNDGGGRRRTQRSKTEVESDSDDGGLTST